MAFGGHLLGFFPCFLAFLSVRERERKKHKRDDSDGAEDMSGDGGGGGGSNSFLEALFCAKRGAESLASIIPLRHQKAYEKG